MRYMHDVGFDFFCHCGDCEQERTEVISSSTSAHIRGEFDVEKARAEVAREFPRVVKTSWA